MNHSESTHTIKDYSNHFGDDYVPQPDRYDEMRAEDGSLRRHWQYVLNALHALGAEEIELRWREARRLIRDNGITYNIYSDPQGVSRPWELDPIPLLIRSEEWSDLERGLIQRAEVLNHVLLDLYGERQLIHKGIVPVELVDGYHGYLFPCYGVESPTQCPLTLYGVDLMRAPDGQWRVSGDRTQSPSGAGYALENRVVLSRALPSLFRDSHVHRLAGFYRSLRRGMQRLAPAGRERARIALLTPGPSHEAYFEHAYLANYLGYALVQGADLSVRDGALWLRTLGGLKRIDVLLRRVDDGWCDPLELREDSLLGVPGLVAATRAGNLGLGNALGSGVLEHPGFMAFMPQLCQYLLGEELLLPQLRTWWCGHPKDCQFVLAHLETLVIKSVHNTERPSCLFGRLLTAEQKSQLSAQIRAEPSYFVAQEEALLSTAPAYLQGRIQPQPFILRSFVIADEQGYTVMPGGLSRVIPETTTLTAVNQLAGLGKDTWVLATEPERHESLLIPGDQTASIMIADPDVSSRIADNLFWIGRYAERAEGLVRILRVIVMKLAERFRFRNDDHQVRTLHALLRGLTYQTQTYPGFVGADHQERLNNPIPEMLSLMTDADRCGSLPQILKALGQAAWSVRDRLSNDTWRIINDIEQRQRTLTHFQSQALDTVLDILDPLITSLVAFAALTQENMTHNEGWHFLEIGRRLERGANSATLLRATLISGTDDNEEDHLIVEAVLSINDSLMAYRRRYQGGIRVSALLDLVFADETNPRSLAYQLVRLQHLVHDLPRAEPSPKRSAAQKLLLRLVADLRLAELDQLVRTNSSNQHEALAKLLVAIETGLAELSDLLTAQYFRHEERPHHFLELLHSA
jgi:uncharacterized circularly permuted ATP-grasp superfamily protein/uncharacterized alpha-E superfamily protein